jgi:hypothetical protein
MILAFITSCGGVPIVGLHPEYPPVEKGTFALFSDFVLVDSLQPTFRWQPFPRPEDRSEDKSGRLNRIQDVTYELRIWRLNPGKSGKLYYAREGLNLTHHKLEEPLEPSTKYLWSIRAHFMLDGNPRTIEWGLAGKTLRDEAVPNKSCFRFRTPEMTSN